MTEVVIKVIGNYSYQTSKCLGEGVYGKVYQGIERETKEKVAIKKIDLATFTYDKYLENAIFSEIYLLKRFNHLNIVKFKDVLSSKNSLYIITQFCKNGDLKQLIKRKRFRQEEVFEVMRQIMNGFSELVRERIIHRDLKPANILIHQNTYKIADFGFAKYVDNFGTQMLKSCVGSPIYMAPQILERAPYTTKCDIWSMGVIFYQMIFGYPPWKARDQYELLRAIKSIPISHIIKRENLSTKASEFLKKTLAYSEDQRVSWDDLFSMFNLNTEVKTSPTQIKKTTTEKLKQVNNWTPTTTNNRNISSGSMNTNPSTTSNSSSRQHQYSNLQNSPERRRSGNNNNQIQNVTGWRQLCIYNHYYCVQLLQKYQYLKYTLVSIESFANLLFLLSTLVKNKSTYSLSLIPITIKQNKSADQLQKKMKLQHQVYDMIYNDITNKLEKQGVLKKIKEDYMSVVGRSDSINEQKIEKIENQVVSAAHQTAQILSQEVKKRGRNIKDYTLVEILDFTLDVLSLGLGKLKALKQIKEQVRTDDDDIKNYLTRVINKSDRMTETF